jgi:MFS family permease
MVRSVERSRNDAIGPSRLRLAFRALGHRNFRLFIAGQLVSLVGTWMQTVAQSWLVYRLTGSAALLGLVGFASQIPVFLLASLGGTLADRAGRREILIATQTASMLLAFALAGLTLTGAVHVWHVFALAALLGVVNAADIPARQAFVVEMVGRDDMMNAIALNSSIFNGARVVGPAVAGLLVASIGEGWCFFANGVSYLAVIAGLFAIHVPRAAAAQSASSTLEHVAEGFRFVARARPVRALLLLLGVISLVGMPYAVLMPIFADRILHAGASGLGILMGASGVGALVGSLALAARRGILGLGRWVVSSAAGLGVALALFAVSRVFWLSAVLLVPVGFSMMLEMAASNTLIQAMVPDALRGRVMAVYSMMFMGMAPLGSLGAGWLAERIGTPEAVALGGALSVVAAVLFGLRLPALRVEGRQLVLANQMVAGDPAQEAAVGLSLRLEPPDRAEAGA